MKRATFFVLAGILFAGSAYPQSQSQSGTQAGASAASDTSAEASRSGGVQAGNSSSAAASAQRNGSQDGSSAANKSSAGVSRGGAQVGNSTVNSGSAKNAHGSGTVANGSTMNATLTHPVDAKKNKPGDPVTARTTQPSKTPDGRVLPKGTELSGYVTQAQARSKDQSQSELGILFDKAILKNGQEVPVNATIQAIAASSTAASAVGGADDLQLAGAPMASGGVSRGGGLVGGGAVNAVGGATSTLSGAAGTVTAPVGNVGSTVGGTVGSTANVAGKESRGAAGGLNAAGQLTSDSRGVFNMQGLNLASSASNAARGSLITSNSKNIHLDGGTQLLLSATGDAQTQAAK